MYRSCVLLALVAYATAQRTIVGTLTCNQVVTGDTTNGGNTVGNSAPENWWRFTAPRTAIYTFDTCGSSYDTWVHIYMRSGTTGVGSQVSTCDDCGPCGVQTVLTTQLTSGDYWVVMDGFSTSRGRYRLVTPCTIVSTTTVGCGVAATGTTVGQPNTNAANNGAPDVYLAFTAPSTGTYTIDTCGSSFDTYMYVYNRVGTSQGSLVSSCDDCGPCGLRTVLTANLVANNAYWIVVDGFSTSSGSYRVLVTCPGTIAGTISCGGTVTGTTIGGTNTVGNSAPERWYMFTATYNGIYVFNSCGSAYDTYIHVYNRTGSAITNRPSSPVSSCDDCGPCGLRTVLTVNLSPGAYWVVMDGFSTSAGAYRMTATCTATRTVVGTITCNSVVTGNTASGSNTQGHAAPENWYYFTATSTGSYTFNSCGSAYDTYLYIYSRIGTTGVGSVVSSCDDCGPCGLRTVLTATLTANTYWLVVDGFSTSSGGYRIQTTCPGAAPAPTPSPTRIPTPQPTLAAVPVVRGTVMCGATVTGSTIGGSNNVGNQAPENWWMFQTPSTVTASSIYTFNTCGSLYDTYVHVYQRTAGSSNAVTGRGAQVSSCDDCGPCGLQTVLQVALAPGAYWIVIDGFANSQGTYRMTVGCAPTLLQTAAQCNQVMSGSTAGGSSSAGGAAPDVWWPFQAPNTGVYTFNSCGSSYDTWIHIFTRIGTTGIGSQIATCDDCGPCGVQTVLSTALTAGSYWVVMDGFSTSQGNYRYTITCPGATGAPSPAPTSSPSFPTMMGTVTCNNAVTGSTTGGVSTVGHNAPENWWMFTATDGGIYTLDSCGSGFDTYIHVYNRTGPAITNRPSSPVATCDDCGPCGLRTVLTVNLDPGNYWFVMDGFGTSNGAYRLLVSCPNERTIVGRITCGGTVTGSTTNSNNTQGHNAPENWYMFVADVTGSYTFNSCGSAYDTYIYVYTRIGTTGVGSVVSSCDDCGPCGLRTVLTSTLSAGAYWVVMDGFSTSSGTYTLSTTCPSLSAAPVTAAPVTAAPIPMGSPTPNPTPPTTPPSMAPTNSAPTPNPTPNPTPAPTTTPTMQPTFPTCASGTSNPCNTATTYCASVQGGVFCPCLTGFYRPPNCGGSDSPTCSALNCIVMPAPTPNPTVSPTIAPTTSPSLRPTTSPTPAPTTAMPTTLSPIVLVIAAPTNSPVDAGASSSSSGGGSGFPLLYIILIVVAILILAAAVFYAKRGNGGSGDGAAGRDAAFSNPMYAESGAGKSNPAYGEAATYEDVAFDGQGDQGYLETGGEADAGYMDVPADEADF